MGRRTVIVLVAGALALVIVLGGVALATRLGAPEDFGPFTMRVTWWTSAATQRQGLAPEPGTSVQQLEYRNIDSWKLTVVSSSWDPGVVGTAIEVNGGMHSTFVAQARKLVSRVTPLDQGPMAPQRWLVPGLIDELSRQGFVRLSASPVGTATFIERGASTAREPGGTSRVVNGTVVVLDLASRLPHSVKTYRDGVLRESFEYEVLSRP